MELKQALKLRHSIRSYNDQRVSSDDLETILKAGCAAPVGLRAYDSMHLTIVQQEEALHEICRLVAEEYKDPAYDPLYGATTLVLVTAKPKFDVPLMESCNAGCILENMLLQATELGIGSVYLMSVQLAFGEGSPMYERLQIPEGFRIVSGAAFGYTDESATEPRQLSLSLSTNMIR